MYKKLNDRRKHKTAYPQHLHYLVGSYRLSVLLKLITLSHETNKIMATRIRVITNEKISFFQINKLVDSFITKE